MINNKKEIWKSRPDIVGVEVSTFGRVRTLDRVVSNGKGTRHVKGHVFKQFDNGSGYLYVSVPIDGKWTKKYVHRLVAQTFIHNQDNLPQVNHKDCDRTNNSVDNLEWCTRSYNRQYQEKYGKAQGKPMFAVNLASLEVLHFCSQSEASQTIGINRKNINSVIKGRYKYTHGFWFVSDDGHAVYVVKRKLHDIGGTGLKIYN